MADTASDVLSVARAEMGYSRYADPEAGTKYGRWYAEGHGSYYGSTGVPYCAMFVSWVFAQAGATCDGVPEAYCPYIVQKARAAGSLLSDKTRAQAGDVVLFDWGSDGVADHVGLVELNLGSCVQTVEGNVSGTVARRTRAWSDVCAVVRPSYGGSAGAGTASGGSTSSSPTGAKLLMDCDAGVRTFAEWATQLGLSGSDADGYVSYQYAPNKAYMRSVSAAIYNWVKGTSGSPTVKAIQTRIGSANVDGVWGAADSRQLHTYMNSTWGYHMVVDDDFGPITAYNVQDSLNKGLWR
jgi:hypothetical protein